MRTEFLLQITSEICQTSGTLAIDDDKISVIFFKKKFYMFIITANISLFSGRNINYFKWLTTA